MDENNPYDGSGLAPRVCTDLACLAVFLVFSIGLCCIAVYAFQNGDPRRLSRGYDFGGRLCGVDPGVEDKPWLYWCGAGSIGADGIPAGLDLKFPTCVDECPSDVFMEVLCLGLEKVEVDSSGKAPFRTVQTEVTQSDVKQMSYPTLQMGGLFCIPQLGERRLPGKDALTESLLGPNGPVGNNYSRLIRAVGGLYRCWPVVLASLGLSVVLGYAYLLMLRMNPRLLVQATLLALPFAAFGVGAFFLLGEVLSGHRLYMWETSNPLYHQFDARTAVLISRGVAIAFGLLGLALLCAAVCLQESVRNSIGCARAACEVIFSVPSLLLQPLVEALWKSCVGAIVTATLIWLLSTAHEANDYISVQGIEVGGLTRTFVFSDEGKTMVACCLFGLLWIMEFATALSQFVVTYTVVLWYYTPKPKGSGPHIPLIRGLIVGVLFHTGTLAMGAFLLSTLRVLRVLLGLLERIEAGQNSLCIAISVCSAGCCELCRRNVELVHKNAYIEVCISSASFCEAAQNAAEFIADEGGRVLCLTGACFVRRFGGEWVFSSACVLGISAVAGGATYAALCSGGAWSNESSADFVADPFFVSAVAALLGAFVARSFAVVFDHTADTLLYAYLWNKANAHNTVQKYAPESLMHLTEYKPLLKPPRDTVPGPVRRPAPGGGGVLSVLSGLFTASRANSGGYKYEEMQSLMH
mmetsp:Transcript_59882/g.194063  ORF Transcript_59882/g.194063 Transcript_59882/m.194063 type:complete len:694 (+) Transcript_59882:952-3033(+)